MDYDLVHFHGARTALYVSLPLLVLLGKRVIAKVSCANNVLEVGSLRRLHGRLGGLLARLVRSVDLFVAISNEIREGLLEDGISPNKIAGIPNCAVLRVGHRQDNAEGEKLRNELGLEKRFVVTFCGRLDPRKGLDTLLTAWQKIIRKRREAVLLIVGDGPIGGNLKKSAIELGIDDSVRFLGWQEKVSDFLRITDIFVHPSLQEGLSNTLLEAMAFGLPVIGTRIGGTVDVVTDGQNGILVEPGDSNTLAQEVLRLMEDRRRAMSLGRAAFKTIESRYSVEKVFQRYIEIYDSLCRQGEGRKEA
jgi:glycosyltransferase involved in cell wall biosynthesis